MRSLIAVVAILLAMPLLAQKDPVSRSWNQPVEPFRIIGNVYYVGASDVTSYLITSPAGHIVIDGGFEETAPMILSNIEKLGFRPADVRILVASHAHYDHAGGLAALKKATGARFLASREDVPLFSRGGLDDPQFANLYPFPSIVADGFVADQQVVRVGSTALKAHLTPGHTRGCTTWTTSTTENGLKRNVVFVCSASAPQPYRLVGNPRYPDAVADYQRTFARLRAMRPDVFLAAHGNFFDLTGKRAARSDGEGRNPFIDPEGFRSYVARSEELFVKKRQEQSGVAAQPSSP